MRKLAFAVVLGLLAAVGAANAQSYLTPWPSPGPFMGPYQTQNLRTLKAQPAHANPFNSGLQREYGALGEEWLAESDHQHADLAIRKGYAAGNGLNTLPEDPRTWWLPGRSRAELYDWHGKLIQALDANRASRPAPAARAQAMYDCWVEQEHEDVWMRDLTYGLQRKENLYQPEDIAKCRNAFFCAMQEMGFQVPIQCVETQDINFRFGQPFRLPGSRADLWPGGVERELGATAPSGLATLDALAGAMRANANSNVQLKGHTDTVGGVAMNQALSERRALLIRAELTRAGVNPARITFRGVGKEELAVPTPDQTRNVRNRRVSYILR